MKLTDRQQLILAAVYHQAERTSRQLGRQLRLQEHTVRREIEALTANGVIRRQAFIDTYRLGYTQYELYLSLGAADKTTIARFLNFLRRSPVVPWVGQFSGAYQYVLTVCARSPYEVQEFVNQLGAIAGVAFVDRQLSIRLSYTEFPLRVYDEATYGPKRLTFGVPGNEKIDETDHRILQLLSQRSVRGAAEVADELDIPSSTAHARIKRLEQKGIVAGYTYVVDFSKVGIQAFSLLLKTKSHSSSLTKKLLSFCEQNRSVGYVTENIGAFDYKVGVLLADPSEILAVSQRLGDALKDEMLLCSALTAFDYLKVTRYPFDSFEALALT